MINCLRKIERSVFNALESAGIHSVLVAVSGGADSVALLCACVRTATRLGLKVEAVNCNFHLRGEESDRDSEFTAELCRNLGVKLHRMDYDVDAYISLHPGISTEMACRELRYPDFFRICREYNLDRVAVAHNADDDIETMMMNLLRGSGSRGLRGMDLDNGKVIRPFLGVTRKEIETYLSAIGQDFITDSSNLTSDYRRNFIRREVLPLLESRWCGARKALARTLSILKEESDIIDAYYRRQLQNLCPDINTLLVYSEGVTAGTIQRFIEPFGGNTSIAEDIFESITKPFCKRSWKLGSLHSVSLERDRLLIIDNAIVNYGMELIWSEIKMSDKVFEEIKKNKSHDIIYLPQNKTAYELRMPKTGDRISPLGMKGTRLVSDIISDARLDIKEKSMIRVLYRISDGEIIWVTGLKRSKYDLISVDAPICYKAEYKAF
ncbi:MAG: tRNA lysidine(34) synthetase TilS [Muribaculaceae bacterium]|nr:tRNA lysidine(34) synthetase TilS [Muribaculaceae bacterium]